MVESYRLKTRQTINHFMRGNLSFVDCIAQLEDAVGQYMPDSTTAEFEAFAALALANNGEVMKEMERRGSLRLMLQALPTD